jgi:hypothetical protein
VGPELIDFGRISQGVPGRGELDACSFDLVLDRRNTLAQPRVR